MGLPPIFDDKSCERITTQNVILLVTADVAAFYFSSETSASVITTAAFGEFVTHKSVMPGFGEPNVCTVTGAETSTDFNKSFLEIFAFGSVFLSRALKLGPLIWIVIQ